MKSAFIIALLLTTAALPDDRAKVEQAYRRSNRAMSLKYIDGVFSIQSPQFKLIDPEGAQLDPVVQRGRLEQMLSTALRVEEESKILTFDSANGRAHCQVSYRTRLHRVDPGSLKPTVVEIRTLCQDDWIKAGVDWLLILSKVTQQESQIAKP